MRAGRRQFICAAGLLPLVGAGHAATRRVVVIGGGWGGLAAARHLRALAPEVDVLLIDRQPAFVSFALSNRWLVDNAAPPPERHDYAALAARWGYRFRRAEVDAIDRTAGVVVAGGERLPYDWLVIAPGIREDYAAWQVDDPATVAELRRRHSGAMANGAELPALKQRLASFTGGDLLLTIPPAPYRCPPAPYERALLIAWWLQTRKIPGKLIIADPNPIMPVFRSILLDRFKDQITYLDHAQVRRIDPLRKTISTDIDDIRFDEALLCPPQQAADLLWRAGLIRAGRQWPAQRLGGAGRGRFPERRRPAGFYHRRCLRPGVAPVRPVPEDRPCRQSHGAGRRPADRRRSDRADASRRCCRRAFAMS